MRRIFALTLLSLALAAPAEASVVEGDQPELLVPVVAGSLGGIATSIAAIVYALDDRAFDDAWILGSMFSTAVSGAMFAGFLANAPNQPGSETLLGALFFGALTAWPAYWTVKTALAEVEPGERFDSPLPAGSETPVVDVRPLPSPALTFAIIAIEL